MSLIVPVPDAVVIAPPLEGLDNVTDIVSADSTVVSSIVETVIVAVVWFAAKLTVPEAAVKSLPEVAVPEAVA